MNERKSVVRQQKAGWRGMGERETVEASRESEREPQNNEREAEKGMAACLAD